jgi:hypothetical protein
MDKTYIPLRCLAGAGAPEDLLRDLRRLGDLPDQARQNIWTLLGAMLNERLPADIDARGLAFAEVHQLDPKPLAELMRGYRTLLRNAFVVNASPEDLANDLDAVARDEAEGERLRQAILPGFPAARALLQQEASGGAIGDHGALLERVDWRLDRVVASTRGDASGAFVGMLTLHYRQGGEKKQLSLQALPQTLAQLRDASEQIVRAAEKAQQAPDTEAT